MNCHILIPFYKLSSIPSTIKLVHNFGEVTLHVEDVLGNAPYTTGDHIYLQGDVAELIKWFATLGPIWMGKGNPMMQEFNLLDYSKPPAIVGA